MKLAVVLILGAFGFVGCVTREDIRSIQTDIYGIQQNLEKRLGTVSEQTDNVQTSQADLATEIQELNGNLNALQAELQNNQKGMERLALRLDDLEASLTARMDSQIELLSGSKFAAKPLPSTVFNLANSDFARGKNEQAILGFADFVKEYPKSEKVPEAYLKMGDAYAKQKEYAKAIDTFDLLINNFADHTLVPPALLKKGKIYEDTGQESKAKDIYTKIVQEYSHRNEATLAQERYRALQNTIEQ